MEPTQNQESNSLQTERESIKIENQKIEEATPVVQSELLQSGSVPDSSAAKSYLTTASSELKITLPTINAKKLYSICVGMFVASSLGAILALPFTNFWVQVIFLVYSFLGESTSRCRLVFYGHSPRIFFW